MKYHLRFNKLPTVFGVCILLSGCGGVASNNQPVANEQHKDSTPINASKPTSVETFAAEHPEQKNQGTSIRRPVTEIKTSSQPKTKVVGSKANVIDQAEIGAVRQALVAFRENKLSESKRIFEKLLQDFPNNPVTAYYLGLIALQEGNHAITIKHWKRYIQLDPKAAKENQIPSRLASIENEKLNGDVKHILKNEEQLSQLPPEPNSIAVFTFANRGEAKYSVFAKGITALVITDLSKVPGLKVLEREKINKVLAEIQLSKTKLVKQDDKVRAGKLMKAEKLMFGDFSIK